MLVTTSEEMVDDISCFQCSVVQSVEDIFSRERAWVIFWGGEADKGHSSRPSVCCE